MKTFEIPEIIEMDLQLEPVFAASGGGGTETETGGQTEEWTIGGEWCNHNSGSHSELKIKAHNNGVRSGYNLKMDFFIRDFRLNSITTGDSCITVSNQTENSFTLTRTNRKYNGGESIEFVMQLTAKKANGEVGAVGVSGVYMPCNIVCFSYSAT